MPRYKKVTLPPFSANHFQGRLEALRLAFEARGVYVTKSLQAPLTETELRRKCGWFPSPLPAELVALYGWHNGQPHDPPGEEHPFWFRDYGFSSIENAEREYQNMMASYGKEPGDHELLKHAFPFCQQRM